MGVVRRWSGGATLGASWRPQLRVDGVHGVVHLVLTRYTRPEQVERLVGDHMSHLPIRSSSQGSAKGDEAWVGEGGNGGGG